MGLNLFKKKKYINVEIKPPAIEPVADSAPAVPDGLFVKCPSCQKALYQREFDEYKICPNCGGYFRLSAFERLNIIADEDTFYETGGHIVSKNPMGYPGYEQKILKSQEATGLDDAVLTGVCRIKGIETVICIMDSFFIMGSMGSVVGEKITRAFELATEKRLPIVIFTASGGARMQEGIISLMQMAKVSAAAKRHADSGLLYISVLTDPTTGGVTASFAMLSDIILAEEKALVGFAGRRVIEQTISQKLPDDFQTAEFLLQKGFVDSVVKRRELKQTLYQLLDLHGYAAGGDDDVI